MRAVFAETFGSGSFGIGLELADTRDLSTVLTDDLEELEREEDFVGVFFATGVFFTVGLEADPLAVLDNPLGFVAALDFIGELVDLLAFDLGFASLDALRRIRL